MLPALLLLIAADCTLMDGSRWADDPKQVTPVVCKGRKGFFVPTEAFQGLNDVRQSATYKILEEQLHVATLEIDALRMADRASQDADREGEGGRFNARERDGNGEHEPGHRHGSHEEGVKGIPLPAPA